jgi:hypothetical protein
MSIYAIFGRFKWGYRLRPYEPPLAARDALFGYLVDLVIHS